MLLHMKSYVILISLFKEQFVNLCDQDSVILGLIICTRGIIL